MLLGEHISYQTDNSTYVYKELHPSRVKTDKAAVEKVTDLLQNVFTNPWSQASELTSLTTGLVATPEVRRDLLEARERGFSACKDFITDRCSQTPSIDFFDPLKRLKLKTFKDLKATKKNTI